MMLRRGLGAGDNSSALNSTGNGHCSHQSSNQDFDQISWVIAITLAILAAISNNLGVNFQKLAWTKKQNDSSPKTYRCLWIAGMAGIILASVFDFIALAFGPQSVIAPLGALTMVLNGCVAPAMHGEKVRKKIIWTTCIIVTGCALAVATASHENVICDFDGIFGYFASYTFLGYGLTIIGIVIPVVTLIRKAEVVATTHGVDSKAYLKIFKFHRVSYAFIAGLFGAQSVVFARAIGQLVMSSTRGNQLFLVRWETWLIILALILMIVIQMIYLNKGLERFESTYNVPVFTGTFIVGTAVSGGVVYAEFSKFSTLQAILFPLGVSLCVLGVFALAWSNDEEPNEVDDDTVGEMQPPAASRPNSLVLATPRSSLRLHSGGFTPFVIGIHDDPLHVHAPRRVSSPGHHHVHGRDLLTGLRVDDISPHGSTGRVFFTGRSSVERRDASGNRNGGTGDLGKPITPRTTKNGSNLVSPARVGIQSAPSLPVTMGVEIRPISPKSLTVVVSDELLRPLSPDGVTERPPEGFY